MLLTEHNDYTIERVSLDGEMINFKKLKQMSLPLSSHAYSCSLI
ncbi:hypothetical protein N9N67_05935 [Bacteriovoracaceae bacterium]|nr:hypothetical protein [Bacteriovoracaceae bacterium]